MLIYFLHLLLVLLSILFVLHISIIVTFCYWFTFFQDVIVEVPPSWPLLWQGPPRPLDGRRGQGKWFTLLFPLYSACVKFAIASMVVDIACLFAGVAPAVSTHSQTTRLGRALCPLPSKSQVSQFGLSYHCWTPRNGWSTYHCLRR
jgi:hypothetical protein